MLESIFKRDGESVGDDDGGSGGAGDAGVHTMDDSALARLRRSGAESMREFTRARTVFRADLACEQTSQSLYVLRRKDFEGNPSTVRDIIR